LEGEIYYLQETDEGTVVKRFNIVDLRIEKLDRIENKLDKLLSLIGVKEHSN